MKSSNESQELQTRKHDYSPDDSTHPLAEEEFKADESDLDESELQEVDDGQWDVFILDDDGDPLPEYGDFWFPD